MTETLTYNPAPTDAPELTEDEQNSLEVAEKLGEEEAKQYAGKFENAEELEKAYIELQKKFGSDKDDDKAEKAESESEKEEKEEEEIEDSPGVSLINDATKEWNENDGKLSDETMAKFSDMSSKELVEAYMEASKSSPAKQDDIATDMSDEQVKNVQDSVGGQQKYNDILQWAVDNLDQSEIKGFDSVVELGNPEAIKIAISGMKSKYDEANGYEGRMLQGKPAQTSNDAFRSQAEVVKAMSDPRYDSDPAYRQDIYDKLERSNLKY